MLQTEVEVKGGKAAIGAIQLALKQQEAMSEELLMDIATECAQRIRSQAETQKHIFTGNLVSTIVPFKNSKNHAEVTMNFYGLFVEGGTKGTGRPHSAPPQLKKWVAGKLGKQTPQPAGFIADTIRRKGTKAHWFIRNAMTGYVPDRMIEKYVNNLKR
jgi:hypothetical protein